MNQEKDIVIIGCGAGGGTAAQFARKTDRKTNITIFEKGKYPQYSKCALPYTISGEIPDFDDLIEFDENWFKKANIDLFLDTTVEKIDVGKKIVYVKTKDAEMQKSYNSLIICTGAKPVVPNIQNITENGRLLNGVFVVRTIDDAKKISGFVQTGKKAVVVGAGLIGMEIADVLFKKGMQVIIVEALSSILPKTLDEYMSDVIHQSISGKISIFTNHLVTSVEKEKGRITSIVMKNKVTGQEEKIGTDLLVVSAGCKPEVDLAKKAGCKIGSTGGIVVNDKCETSVKNIYAVGDCTEFIDFVTKESIPIGLGSIAVRQGITAGINASGGNYQLPNGFLQTCTSEFFGFEIASVGPSSYLLKTHEVVSGRFNGSSLPSYYPGGKPITIKVFADSKNGRILGAQAVGDKAAQRINTFACAILNNMDIESFRKLETAYAPPIAPTLDAVTLVCDIISMKISRKR